MDEPIQRDTKYSIHPIIKQRWSPRSMTGESISDEEFFSLIEAARQAPSSFNNQPWLFLYAKRETPEWELFFDLMTQFNQSWTKNAAVLLVIISYKNFYHNKKPSRTHSYDTGAAWMSLALQGSSQGLVIHGMEGFDYEKAKAVLQIPDDYQVEAMAAIGKKAPKETLSQELQKMEILRPRKPLHDIMIKGKFSQK